METFTTYTFENTEADKLSVTIRQIADEDFGLYVWPVSLILSEYLFFKKSEIISKAVIELGAGTAVPSLVVSGVGGYAILTDKADDESIIENMEKIVELNSDKFEIKPAVLPFSWGKFTPEILELNPDFIIGADCFYDSVDWDDIFMSVSYFMKKNSKLRFIVSYQERSSNKSFVYFLQKWQMQAIEVDLDTFVDIEKYTETGVEWHLFEITSK